MRRNRKCFSSRVRRPADRHFPSDAAGIGTGFSASSFPHVTWAFNAFGHAGVHGKVISMNSQFPSFAAGARRRRRPRLNLRASRRTISRRPSSPPRALRCRSTPSARRSSSSRATTSSVRSPATSASCCSSMPASRSRATAVPAKLLRCSRAAPRATTPWCSSTACASTPAPSAARRCRTSRPNRIERIEIVKGPRSSLYGTDAIGGVVQLFTRGAAKDGVSAGATYGSDATQQLFGDAALSAGEQSQASASAAVMPRATACRCSSTTTSIAAIATSPAARSREFAATDALTFRARGWRTAGRTEYSDADLHAIRRMRPPRRTSRTACIPSKANTARETASACAPA